MSSGPVVPPPMDPGRPGAGEFAPYYLTYVAAVPDGDIRIYLAEQAKRVTLFLDSIAEHRWAHRYAEGKWSVREVISHVNDTERIMSYRMLRFARADETPLAGFDEKTYVPASNAEARTPSDLVDEFRVVRRATLALVRSLPSGAWLRAGDASGARVTVRGLAWIIAGHVEHHTAVLRERYLS